MNPDRAAAVEERIAVCAPPTTGRSASERSERGRGPAMRCKPNTQHLGAKHAKIFVLKGFHVRQPCRGTTAQRRCGERIALPLCVASQTLNFRRKEGKDRQDFYIEGIHVRPALSGHLPRSGYKGGARPA